MRRDLIRMAYADADEAWCRWYLRDRVTGDPLNAETFDLDAHLDLIDITDLDHPDGRREHTRLDPLLFAYVYTPSLLCNADGVVTFSDIHLGLYRDALDLREAPGIEGDRRAYAAPRGSGKSTTLWLITNLWLACHHPTFVAAFSDTGTQSVDHLKTIRKAMTTSVKLREDYPGACSPLLNSKGMPVADSAEMYCAQNGFSFSARGINTGVLGLVDPDNRRPQILLLDDIEGAEGAGYSLYQAEQDLKTITESILPMNDRAHVRIIGTVHLAGGILDDLVSSVTTSKEPAKWITEERFTVTHFPPIVTRPDGTTRSCWPGRWPIEYLESIQHTRAYAKSFLNQPMGADGGFWLEEDITLGTCDTLTRRLLVIDPAVTQKRSSDRTGVAVVAFSPTEKRCVVEYAVGVQLTGKRLADYLLKLVATYPTPIHRALVEVNQGGDLWAEVLEALPIKVLTHHAKEPKEVRFARVLEAYQKRPTRVLHADRFPVLEAELLGFPRAAHDDVADAVCAGIDRLLNPPKRVQVGATTVAYT